MFENIKFGMLPVSRTLRAGAAAVLIAASVATGAGPVAASTGSWALLIQQKQATAVAGMRHAGIGPSLAGGSAPDGR